MTSWLRSAGLSLVRWFDNEAGADGEDLGSRSPSGIDWVRLLPFIGVHLACLGVIWVGWSPFAVAVAVAMYAVRMFAITGFYHRFFSHRSFRTSRAAQFVFAVIGAAAVQRGPLWWAAHHRHHHRVSDTEDDPHSPERGFLTSHLLWFMSKENFRTRHELVRDLGRYPELRLLDRFDMLTPIVFAAGLFGLGALCGALFPSLGTSGPQLLIWGFFISTVVLYHATFTINSLAHTFGSRRYETRDTSRNNLLLALLTLGEGWHNNHHRYPGSVRQGFRWWEIDLTYYALRLLSLFGIVWDLRPVPARVLAEPREGRLAARARG